MAKGNSLGDKARKAAKNSVDPSGAIRATLKAGTKAVRSATGGNPKPTARNSNTFPLQPKTYKPGIGKGPKSQAFNATPAEKAASAAALAKRKAAMNTTTSGGGTGPGEARNTPAKAPVSSDRSVQQAKAAAEASGRESVRLATIKGNPSMVDGIRRPAWVNDADWRKVLNAYNKGGTEWKNMKAFITSPTVKAASGPTARKIQTPRRTG